MTGPYFRERSKGGFEGGVRTYTETSFSGNVNTTTSEATGLLVGETQKTTDVVTPGFHRLSKSGVIFNHPFITTKVTRGHNLVGHKVQRNSGSGSSIKYFESPTNYSSIPTAPASWKFPNAPIHSMNVEAGTLARSRVNRPDIEGLVELAEAKKARDILRFRLGNFNKMLIRLMLAKSKRAIAAEAGMSLADVVSNNWLRYRYGIMPAVYLLEDALVGERVRNPHRETARGNASWSGSNIINSSTTGTFFRDDWSFVEVYTLEVRAGVLYRPTLTYNRYGVDPREILPAVIELTPYSFVADWFVNVSPYVRSIVATAGIKTLASWTTTTQTLESTATVTSTWLSPSGYTLLRTPSGSSTTKVVHVERYGRLETGLVFRDASIKQLADGDMRTIDAFALAYSGLRGLILGPKHGAQHVRAFARGTGVKALEPLSGSRT